jgi:hypothetical protein
MPDEGSATGRGDARVFLDVGRRPLRSVRPNQPRPNDGVRCAPVPRHAVWYIMVPPLDGIRHMNPEAPYLEWDAFARYETAPECQTALASSRTLIHRNHGSR